MIQHKFERFLMLHSNEYPDHNSVLSSALDAFIPPKVIALKTSFELNNSKPYFIIGS